MMKNVFISAVSVLAFGATAFAAGDKLKITDVIKKADAELNAAVEARDYAYEVYKKEVEGTCIVVDEKEGKRERHRITLLCDGTKPKKGYNVVLYTDKESNGTVKYGDKLHFKGTIGRVSNIRGTSIDVHGTYSKGK